MGHAICLEDVDEELLQRLLSLNVSSKGDQIRALTSQQGENSYSQSHIDQLKYQHEIELQRQRLEFEREISKVREENNILRSGICSYERSKSYSEAHLANMEDELRRVREELHKSNQRNYLLTLRLAEAMRPPDADSR